jgi:hypothetical protein
MVGALTAPTSMALPCRWRSRPQHHNRTWSGLSVPDYVAARPRKVVRRRSGGSGYSLRIRFIAALASRKESCSPFTATSMRHAESRRVRRFSLPAPAPKVTRRGRARQRSRPRARRSRKALLLRPRTRRRRSRRALRTIAATSTGMALRPGARSGSTIGQRVVTHQGSETTNGAHTVARASRTISGKVSGRPFALWSHEHSARCIFAQMPAPSINTVLSLSVTCLEEKTLKY